MKNLAMVYGNSATEDRYEEMNLWYSWVHIRDVLTAQAARAVQRFELSAYQPKNASTTHRVLACYEVLDTDYWNRWHVKYASTWRMRISSSFGYDFSEIVWDPVAKTSDWAQFADYKGDKGILAVRMKAKGSVKPEEYFTAEKLLEMNKLPGFEGLHLFDWTPANQMPVNTPPADPATHNLVCQISNCYMVAVEWDKFLAANPEVEKNFELYPAVYEPQMRRIRDADLFSSIEWRAIQALAHLTLDDKEGRAYPQADESRNVNALPPELAGYADFELRNFR